MSSRQFVVLLLPPIAVSLMVCCALFVTLIAGAPAQRIAWNTLLTTAPTSRSAARQPGFDTPEAYSRRATWFGAAAMLVGLCVAAGVVSVTASVSVVREHWMFEGVRRAVGLVIVVALLLGAVVALSMRRVNYSSKDCYRPLYVMLCNI